MYSNLFPKLKFKFFTLKHFGALLLVLMQMACSSGPPMREQTKLDLRIEASRDMNQNDRGRSTPVMVRVYELKSAARFEEADFISLQNDGKNVIGSDLLHMDEFILRPGNKQIIRRKAHSETTSIGVLAGFRDLGKSLWRVTYPLDVAPDAAWYRAAIPADKARLKIYLDRQTISITELD